MKMQPSRIFIIYILCILTCACLFYCIPETLSPANKDFVTSLYFSVITITTVGYGDIHPDSSLGKIITASEAFFGIILIGLFLNSLWQSYIERIADEQKNLLIKQEKERSLNRTKTYYIYLETAIRSFKLSIAELTTPIINRKEFTINPDFKFSDLKDLYKPSMLVARGFSGSVLQYYFEKQEELVSELKYFLASFYSHDYAELNQMIIQFLVISKGLDSSDSLLSYSKTKFGEKTSATVVEEMISEFDECPDIEKYRSNLITPVIILFKILKGQIAIIDAIEKNFANLGNQN